MATLKKGAKGEAVVKLQERLNKLKCKPTLKADGQFGKNTVKAVMNFQKTAEIKIDGVVGNWTNAALEYGGALPEMDIENFSGMAGVHEKQQQFNAKFVHLIANLHHVTNRMDTLLDKYLPEARNMVKSNTAYWAQIIKITREIEARQKKFNTILLKNPKGAAKIAKECKMLKSKHDAAVDKISKNTSKVESAISSTIGVAKLSGKQINDATKQLEKHMN